MYLDVHGTDADDPPPGRDIIVGFGGNPDAHDGFGASGFDFPGGPRGDFCYWSFDRSTELSGDGEGGCVLVWNACGRVSHGDFGVLRVGCRLQQA